MDSFYIAWLMGKLLDMALRLRPLVMPLCSLESSLSSPILGSGLPVVGSRVPFLSVFLCLLLHQNVFFPSVCLAHIYVSSPTTRRILTATHYTVFEYHSLLMYL